MCYFRHYNKSSNWYPFVGLETFVHQLPHRQQPADAASFEDHRSPALVYSLLYTASDTVVALFEEYGSSFPAENKAVNIATFAVVRVVLYGIAPYCYLDQSYTFHSYV